MPPRAPQRPLESLRVCATAVPCLHACGASRRELSIPFSLFSQLQAQIPCMIHTKQCPCPLHHLISRLQESNLSSRLLQMEQTGKIPGAIRYNWDHQQPCILGKAVPSELLEIVYLSRTSLQREATSTLSCTEQQASHEYYQLSLSVGECSLPLTAEGSPKMPILSSSLLRCSLDMSHSLLFPRLISTLPW